ncbi:hypothetical protein BCR39DRAFT_522408 [Naematelia encephala]|uniref:Amine oxidase domain-containing protein n=1 Tax=Naematelia encephala TaxID=71784 RepID=A0A1Y2BDL4_9TREE|nr:hypothetical protein BCR39DRAFT_522408 [Naematelia encephala]
MRVAIVGSGVSGISALWLLNEYSEHEVNIYETNDYPGGHTNTVQFTREGKESCMVDTGFIVLNPPTYPNFLRFLRHLQIPLNETDMTFSISRDHGAMEWAGGPRGLAGVFCQLTNLLNPRLYRMIFDIVRFNLFATDLLKEEGKQDGRELSIGEYLDREGYGIGFRDDYLLPMTAAIWSTPADTAALDFPASTLIRFFYNHHLLQLTGKPKWLTVKGGSKRYVDAVLKKLPPENLHLNTGIVSVATLDSGVELVEASGARHVYDHVILATHSDTALDMLRAGGGVSPQEEKALGPWQWSQNEAVLHWDERLMPVRRAAWSAWNYLTLSSDKQSGVDTVSLTYGMNTLQSLPEKAHGPVLVTLNPPFPIEESKIVGRYLYDHPMMTQRSVAAQSLLPSIQNQRRISYVGAWTKYGFHEDGFASAMRLVTSAPFDAKPPFPFQSAQRAIQEVGPATLLGRKVMTFAERARHELVPAWIWVSWVIVALLVWAEQVLARVGLHGVRREVVRIRGCWVDEKKRR